MPEYRVKYEGLAYSVVGRLHRAKEGDVLPDGTWDAFTTKKHIAHGYIEEVTNLETAEPEVSVVEEAEKALEDMTVAELKALCKERGLAASGKKADLLARLHGEEE